MDTYTLFDYGLALYYPGSIQLQHDFIIGLSCLVTVEKNAKKIDNTVSNSYGRNATCDSLYPRSMERSEKTGNCASWPEHVPIKDSAQDTVNFLWSIVSHHAEKRCVWSSRQNDVITDLLLAVSPCQPVSLNYRHALQQMSPPPPPPRRVKIHNVRPMGLWQSTSAEFMD